MPHERSVSRLYAMSRKNRSFRSEMGVEMKLRAPFRTDRNGARQRKGKPEIIRLELELQAGLGGESRAAEEVPRVAHFLDEECDIGFEEPADV